LNLGATYEARTRVAIAAGDEAAVHEYASLTAREYRHRHGSPLGSRYERLMEEAMRNGALPSYAPTPFTSGSTGVRSLRAPSYDMAVTEAMTGAETRVMRAQRALKLLYEQTQPVAGYLYLFAGSGLQLAASVGDRPRPNGLHEFVSSRVPKKEDEMVTMTLCLPADEAVAAEESVYVDTEGVIHQPVMLTCTLDNELRYAGIAVLAYCERPERTTSASLAAAVAAHLIRSGDTGGFAASG
jgi:hypothetical protein